MVPQMNLQFQMEYLKEHLNNVFAPDKCSSDFGEKTACPSNMLNHSMSFFVGFFKAHKDRDETKQVQTKRLEQARLCEMHNVIGYTT